MSLQIFSKQTKIDFVGMRHYAYGLSALLILVGLITIFMNGGLRYGVDFAGPRDPSRSQAGFDNRESPPP